MKKLLCLLLLVCSTVMAKDIKLIVPYTAGGSSDQVARALLPFLSGTEHTFQIEYRLGAGGSIAADHLAQLRNETAVMIISNGLIGNPMIGGGSKYDVLRDFVLVKHLGIEPLIMVTNHKTGIRDYKQFQQRAKQHSMPYGSSGIGTSGHVSAAIIANNNPNLYNVPYKGGAGIVTDLISNRLIWSVDSDLAFGPYIENRDLVPLAIYGNFRLAKYPLVPTLKELGVNDRDFNRWHVLVTNTGADPAVIKYLQQRLEDPKVKAVLQNLGLDTTSIKNPENFFALETTKMQKIIKDYNIKP